MNGQLTVCTQHIYYNSLHELYNFQYTFEYTLFPWGNRKNECRFLQKTP